MADLIRMSGLVASRPGQGAAAELGAASRARPTDQREQAAEATAAASLELGPARQGGDEIPAERIRDRQENILRIDTRISALEDAGRMLSGVRAGDETARADLAQRGRDVARLAEAGRNATEVLTGQAGDVDAEKLRNAELEVAGALLMARGDAGAERSALARDMVGSENEVARQADVERVERAAAPLRGQGQPEELAALSEALSSSPMSRGRVLDLLSGGGTR